MFLTFLIIFKNNAYYKSWEKVSLPNKLLLRISALITIFLIFTLLAAPVLAAEPGQAHLWFYSQDPSTLLGPQPLPDPEEYDSNWIDTNEDPWLTESIVISSSSFSLWLGCVKEESLDTKLVVTINEAAFAAIDTIKINGIAVEGWTSGMPSALANHGVFKNAHGYNEVSIGDIYSPPDTRYVTQITIEIIFKEGVDINDAKVHFDAYGYMDDGKLNHNPYSHDATFVVPEAATIILAGSSLIAFGLYAYKRKA